MEAIVEIDATPLPTAFPMVLWFPLGASETTEPAKPPSSPQQGSSVYEGVPTASDGSNRTDAPPKGSSVSVAVLRPKSPRTLRVLPVATLSAPPAGPST